MGRWRFLGKVKIGHIMILLAVTSLLVTYLPTKAPSAHATTQCTNGNSTCFISNQYANTCSLTASGDHSTKTLSGFGPFQPSNYAAASETAKCDGTGVMVTYARAGSGVGQASANAYVSYTDTINVPNYGQTATMMQISGTYLLYGYLLTAGEGTSFGSSASMDVWLKFCGNGISCQSFEQNSGQPWSTGCNQIGAPTTTNGPVCLNPAVTLQSNQTYNIGPGSISLPSTGVGTYTFSLTATANANAWNFGYGSTFGKSCFDIVSCPGAGGQAGSNNCPSITGFTPCYYVEWYSTTYQLTLINPQAPDFSLTTSLPSGTSMLDQGAYGGIYEYVYLDSVNGFSGSVNVYYGIVPAQGTPLAYQSTGVVPPYVHMEKNGVNGGVIGNGTAIHIDPTTTSLLLWLYIDPCAGLIAPAYGSPTCLNGYCVYAPGDTNLCGTKYQPTAPATPGMYTAKVWGVSGGLQHFFTLTFPINYYDFSIKNVVSSYSNGNLSVNATMGNVGNMSPIPQHFTYGAFTSSWGESISYYLDGNLVSSPVALCGQTSQVNRGSFVYYDCPSGKMYSYVWNTPATSGVHNVTITATETAPCCTTYGTFYDVSTVNNRYSSDFGLIYNQTLSGIPVTGPGSSASTTITVGALPDFYGTVSLSGCPSGCPSGWGLSFDNGSVSLGSGQNLNVTATVTVPSSALAGNYTVNITGASTTGGQTLTHSVRIPVQVTDFKLTANPVSITTVGSSNTSVSTVTVTPSNGFTGTVTLMASPSSSAMNCYFSPYNSITSSGTTNMYCYAPAGSYVVTVRGTSGSDTQSTQVTITVRDFSLTVTPGSITIAEGRTSSVTVQATSLNGYAGSISLSMSGSISCASSIFSKPTLSIAAGGSDSATLSITPNTTCPSQWQSLYVFGSDSTNSVSHYGPFVLLTADFSQTVQTTIFGIAGGVPCCIGSPQDIITYTNNNGYPVSSISQNINFPSNFCQCINFGWNSVNLPPSGSATTTLYVGSSPGNAVYDNQMFTLTATDGTITRSTVLQIDYNDYNVAVYSNPVTVYIGSSTANYLQVYPYFGIALTNETVVQTSVSNPCVSIGTPSPRYFNVGPVTPYSFITLPVSASSSCTAGTVQATVTITGVMNTATGVTNHAYDKSVTFNVSVQTPPSGGGGGGSIAHGSLITMADGSKVPVQNLKVGDQMLGYDPTTGKYAVSIVQSITIVDTSNMLIIHTTAGTPFRVDANPRQTLWVKAPDGTMGWTPVTQIKPGDELFTTNGWVTVTSIEFAPAGTHVMYDIVASTPYFTDGYLDPMHKM